MKKWASVIACAALCLVVCAAAALAALKLLRSGEDSGPRYVLRDCGGQIALFEPGNDAPMARYDVYTDLLPEEDAALVREGIPVSGREELERLLEDFGL